MNTCLECIRVPIVVDCNLCLSFQDLAYQVEDVVSFGDIYEGDCFLMYYHLNFTIKTKGGAGGIDNLLFAEVLRRISRGQAEEFELHCLHMLKPADNGILYSLAYLVELIGCPLISFITYP